MDLELEYMFTLLDQTTFGLWFVIKIQVFEGSNNCLTLPPIHPISPTWKSFSSSPYQQSILQLKG